MSRAEPALPGRLRRLGALAPSMGRYLALRPDLVEPAALDALGVLDEEAPPLPWPVVRDVLAAELARPPERLFAALDPLPAASTRLVQVHRGRLRDGGDVQVRVVRPDAAARLRDELRHAAAAERLAGVRADRRGPDWVGDLREWYEARLDLRHELAHLTRLHDGLGERSFERVPRPHPDLCGERVLVTERLEGTSLVDVLAALDAGTGDVEDRLADLGLDPARLAARLLVVVLTQAFRTGLYCADVHPANLLALPGDLLTFADYGRCGVLDPATADAQLAYLAAVCDDHADGMLEPPLDRVELPDGADLGALRADLLRAIRRRGTAEPAAGDFLAEVVRTAAARGVPLADGTVLLYRTFAAAERAARRMDAGTAAAAARRTLRCLQLERALGKLEPRNLQPTLVSVLGLMHDGPIHAQKILADLADGSFALNVSVADAPRTALVRDGHVRLLVVAIGSIGLAVVATAPRLPSVLGLSLAWPLAALLAGVYAWLFLALRRMR